MIQQMFKDVDIFMRAFGQEANKDLIPLYVNLIREESGELLDALAVSDEVEEFDAILDLIFVTVGLLICVDAHTHSKLWDCEGGWKEVVRSNMAKLDPVTGKPIHRADGKVVKPEGWTPPNLLPYIRKKEIA